MPTSFLKRPRVWEIVELVAAIAALASGIIAVWFKLGGAIWGSFCGVGVLVAKFVQRRLEQREREERAALVRRIVGTVLESLRQEYFSKVEEEDRHNHRATLLICEPHPSEDGKRLAIYCRAGKFPSSDVSWQVDDDQEGRCEGLPDESGF